MMVANIFSFSSDFSSIIVKIINSGAFKLSSANGFNLVEHIIQSFGKSSNHGWNGSVVVKRLAINPEVRGSIPGLVGNFLRHLVFPTKIEVNWFENPEVALRVSVLYTGHVKEPRYLFEE